MANDDRSANGGAVESSAPTMTPLCLWLGPRAARMGHASVIGFLMVVGIGTAFLIRHPQQWPATFVGVGAAYWAFSSWTTIGKYLGVVPSRHGLPFWPLGARMSFRRALVWTVVSAACLVLGLQQENWKLVLATYFIASALGTMAIEVPDSRYLPMERTSMHLWRAIRNAVLAAVVFCWWGLG